METVHHRALKVVFVKFVQIRSFFWPVFSRIRTEYREILRISPYSVRIRENTDHKKGRIWAHFTQCQFAVLHSSKVSLNKKCIIEVTYNLVAWF